MKIKNFKIPIWSINKKRISFLKEFHFKFKKYENDRNEKHLYWPNKKSIFFLNKNELKNVDKKNVNKINTFKKEYKIYIAYYGVLITCFVAFSFCIIKLLFMIFEEPLPLKLVKEQVLKDKKLIDEYEGVIFSKFWTGYLNENDAKIMINIKSKKYNKKGKIISNLSKINDKWIIKTLTYYNVKKNDNLKTDDLKSLQNKSNSCPINNNMFCLKNEKIKE
ncbi:conserved Plasmodium protein, unknown function [Plasmodium gallinaceum]|uniref:Uncharacterized protein n=1 Tax=Plasmodium gallinaceum TaxID=5849 RepID=A0A1J1H139_PLAGA|nr:conserved Plasmodium protein, unknown function [Plasmodium gallinaceum]CRG97259.1 conserved Plasmodium protein, unknown function [Plasmodium gallinaceum]